MQPKTLPELLDTAPCGYLSFAEDGKIVQANETLLRMLDFRPDELFGRPVEQLLTLAGRIFYQTHFYPLLTLHGNAEEIFLSLLTKSREELPVLVNAARREVEGRAVYACVMMPVRQRGKYETEILHARRMAEEALQSNEELLRAKRELELHAQELDRRISAAEQNHEELARLGAILSHDLREPVRKVALFADILLKDSGLRLTETGRRAIARINAACGKMEQLISSLQRFVSVDADDEPVGVVDLNEVVRTAARLVSAKRGVPEVRLDVDDLPPVEGYRQQILALFSNLLDNAVKFRRPDAEPHVRVEGSVVQQNSFRAVRDRYRYIDFARIRVTDNSRGFDAKYRDDVFRILTRIDTQALGVGLAISRKVVNNHHGSISVESGRGKGTRFTILLPLKQ